MRTELYKITTGSLLHDVGKVVHRTGDGHSHAESGYAFLKEQAGLDLDKKKMQLGESIKALGTYEIPVKLHPKVTATLRVQVVEE